MVASTVAKWVALSDALKVGLMVDSKVCWREFSRVVRSVDC